MNKKELYRIELQKLENWDKYLLDNSGLPGPRGNIELMQCVVELGTEHIFIRYLTYTPDVAPTNSKEEFLAFCGVAGLGKLVTLNKKKNAEYFRYLKIFANDNRWRIREAVAFALQIIGKYNFNFLLKCIQKWINGTLLEQRAVIAGLCEPVLLIEKEGTEKVLSILYQITLSLIRSQDRKDEKFLTLRKGLGYCWSVAIAANPKTGKEYFEKLFEINDKDINWIIKENLKKNRLIKTDESWVKKMVKKLSPE
jgi:hypothetical protein